MEVSTISNYELGNDELMHYGVLGMKWGVHRGRLTTATNDKIGDSYTDRQKKRITKQAKSILGKKIRSDNSKAGKDFVTNKCSSTNIPLSMLGVINWRTEKRVDFKQNG